jgi:short-subunit dehydrogenase
MYQIKDKVALVTGSSAGLGKNLAFQLLKEGARVILNGRDPHKLKKVAGEMQTLGFEVASIQGDVCVPEDCRRIINSCVEQFGRLDILISNAGQSSAGAFEDTDPETFRKVFEVNTLGTIYITRFALSHIRESSGSIVFISSLAGLVGLPYSSLYSGTKMALTAFSQALRVELSGSGVHVGIAYVGFLKNGPEKRVMGPRGNLQPPGRRDIMSLKPMDEAARSIVRLIRKRKAKIVMSTMGKMAFVTMRFAPWLIRLFLLNNRKKAREIYEPRVVA